MGVLKRLRALAKQRRVRFTLKAVRELVSFHEDENRNEEDEEGH